MAILTFPNIVPEIQDFGVRYNTQVSAGFFGNIAQTVELPGARWAGSIQFSDMTPEESATLKTFLLELRGSSGRFFYGDLSHPAPFNAVTGTPTIDSGSTKRIIRVTLGASSPNFSAGDFIQIGTDDQRELKMVLSSTNISGDTYDITIEPLIRRIDYVGLQVVYNNPKAVFMLTSDDQAMWNTRGKSFLSTINLDFIEAFVPA